MKDKYFSRGPGDTWVESDYVPADYVSGLGCLTYIIIGCLVLLLFTDTGLSLCKQAIDYFGDFLNWIVDTGNYLLK